MAVLAVPTGSVCDNADIQYFWPLSAEPDVQSLCTTIYPVPAITRTTTVTSAFNATTFISTTEFSILTSATTETDIFPVTILETETITDFSTVILTSTTNPTSLTPVRAKRTRKGCGAIPTSSAAPSALDNTTVSTPATSSTLSSSSSDYSLTSSTSTTLESSILTALSFGTFSSDSSNSNGFTSTTLTPEPSSSIVASSAASTQDIFSDFLTAEPSIASAFCSCIETPETTTLTVNVIAPSEISITVTVTNLDVVLSTVIDTITSTAMDTTKTTTTSTTTSTTLKPVPTTCADINNGEYYISPNSRPFSVACNAAFDVQGEPDVIQQTTTVNFRSCIDLCATTDNCAAINYGREGQDCTLLKNLNPTTNNNFTSYDRAKLIGG
ncbi:hypothetical protein G7054_g6482 [Neopestalotiopsis clavispora]|nr:hypothetical protein G7054_g6482 [Neopestalotiopsis clavispora]